MSALRFDCLREPPPRRALPHNPNVETQREGHCVLDEGRGMWLAAPPKLGIGLKWSANPRDAHVFDATTAAFQASVMSCVVTSVPRHNGWTMEWTVV